MSELIYKNLVKTVESIYKMDDESKFRLGCAVVGQCIDDGICSEQEAIKTIQAYRESERWTIKSG